MKFQPENEQSSKASQLCCYRTVKKSRKSGQFIKNFSISSLSLCFFTMSHNGEQNSPNCTSASQWTKRVL